MYIISAVHRSGREIAKKKERKNRKNKAPYPITEYPTNKMFPYRRVTSGPAYLF